MEKRNIARRQINCRDIARVDWRNKDAAKAFHEDPESRIKFCTQLTGDFAYRLGKILTKEKIAK